MGWLIFLGVILLLLILPLGVGAVYDSDGPRVSILAGPVRIPVYPGKKKDQKPKAKKEKKKTEPKAKFAKQPKKEKKGGPLTDFLPLVEIILDFMGDFRRKLRINDLEVNLVLAGGDPCDLAIQYGRYCGAMGNLWPRLEELFVIKKRDIKIQCDFEGSEKRIYVRLDLTITLARAFSVSLRYGLRALKELKKILNKRKGGATT